MPLSREVVDAEIDRIRRRYLSLLESAHETASVWELQGQMLCWYVVLRDVAEPDIDLEVLEDVIVVRAAAGEVVRQSVLPIPAACRAGRPSFRFRAEILEVQLVMRAP